VEFGTSIVCLFNISLNTGRRAGSYGLGKTNFAIGLRVRHADETNVPPARFQACNAAFDQSLRDSNPEWGVRGIEDVERLAASVGLAGSAGRPPCWATRWVTMRWCKVRIVSLPRVRHSHGKRPCTKQASAPTSMRPPKPKAMPICWK